MIKSLQVNNVANGIKKIEIHYENGDKQEITKGLVVYADGEDSASFLLTPMTIDEVEWFLYLLMDFGLHIANQVKGVSSDGKTEEAESRDQ